MKESLLTDMSMWDIIGNLSLSLMIGTEAFAVIGAAVWAFLYYAGLAKVALYSGVALGAIAGILSAVWMFRHALEQWRLQAHERKAVATVGKE